MTTRAPILAAALAIGLLATPGAPQAAGKADGFERGINVSSVFTYPEDAGWPPFRGPRAQFEDEEFDRLAEVGFDFIRLPVDPSPFDHVRSDRRAELFEDVARFVARANGAGLAVIVSGHPTHSDTAWLPEHDGEPGRASFEDYAVWLEDLTKAVNAVAPDRGAAIGLMNEPQSVCVIEDGTDWAEFQMVLHKRVRALTDLPIVLTGGCWSTIRGLEQLAEYPDDPDTLFDVHYYLPFAYTHQGATWATPILAHVGGLRFPPHRTDPAEVDSAVTALLESRHDGTAEEARAIRRDAQAEIDRYLAEAGWPGQIAEDFARLSQWADDRGIARERILLGEFGAIRPPEETEADRKSRADYLRAVRRAAEVEGFGWAMWEYLSPFGLVETDPSRVLMPDVLEALGLQRPAQPQGARQ